MNRTISIFGLCILIFGLTACTGNPTPTPLPTPTSKPLTPVQLGEIKWMDSGIADYEMDIHYRTFGIDIDVHLVVTNNSITDMKCVVGTTFQQRQGQCEFNEGKPEFLTIPRLFQQARFGEEEIERNKISPIPMFQPTRIILDSEYGYPSYVQWYTPEAGMWSVSSFKKK